MNINNYTTIRLKVEQSVAMLYLNRPDVHNAFNQTMVDELLDIIPRLDEREDIRIVLITGTGPSFSAGADIGWMRESVDHDYQDNLHSATRLSTLFYRLWSLTKPVVVAVNGAAVGGAMGFIGAGDIVIASEKAVFGFTEVRLGIIPAVISPYVLRRAGESAVRELFLTGRRFNAREAQEKNLVNYIVAHDRLEDVSRQRCQELLKAGPAALAACKELLRQVRDMPVETASHYTPELLARLRTTAEAQEGLRAFLEKRHPAWIPAE